MVEKIDRPEPPPAYSITKATETKRDKPKEEKGQEDLPTFKFKQETPSVYKEKFQAEGAVSKTVRVSINQVQKLLFRRATPRHGSPTAEADLIWKDGNKTEAISFLLKNWQDFLKIKNFKTGETIPPEFWNYTGDILEVTIRQGPTSGPWNLREIQSQKETSAVAQRTTPSLWQNVANSFGLVDPKTKNLRKTVALLYSIGFLVMTTFIILLFAGF